jgi:hypothetical protein
MEALLRAIQLRSTGLLRPMPVSGWAPVQAASQKLLFREWQAARGMVAAELASSGENPGQKPHD